MLVVDNGPLNISQDLFFFAHIVIILLLLVVSHRVSKKMYILVSKRRLEYRIVAF